jgi:hypothetical protein
MKTTVTEFQFIEAFRLCGRESQFSVNARRALFAHLEDYEDSTGEELTLDPIGICCEWAEYKSPKEAAKDYGFEWKPNLIGRHDASLEWLREQTQVIEFDGGIVIQQF